MYGFILPNVLTLIIFFAVNPTLVLYAKSVNSSSYNMVDQQRVAIVTSLLRSLAKNVNVVQILNVNMGHLLLVINANKIVHSTVKTWTLK